MKNNYSQPRNPHLTWDFGTNQTVQNLFGLIILTVPFPALHGLRRSRLRCGCAGALLRENVLRLWWQAFVHRRPEVAALDSKLVLPANVWRSSGHHAAFQDLLAACPVCQMHSRVEELLPESSLLAIIEMSRNAQWLRTVRLFHGLADVAEAVYFTRSPSHDSRTDSVTLRITNQLLASCSQRPTSICSLTRGSCRTLS